MSDEKSLLASLYIGYFARTPDRDGFQYWLRRRTEGMTMLEIANSFWYQPEAKAIYSNLSKEKTITEIYKNLFNRAPNAEGFVYWLSQVNAGHPQSRLILDFISGASVKDTETLLNEAKLALMWMNRQSSLVPFDVAAAKNFISSLRNWTTPPGIHLFSLDPRLEPHRSLLLAALQAGWAQWNLPGSIEVALEYNPFFGDENGVRRVASAQPIALIKNAGFMQTNPAYEIATGHDATGFLEDFRISIQTDIDWVLGNFPDVNGLATIFAHEIGHMFLSEDWGTTFTDRLVMHEGKLHFNGYRAGLVPLVSLDNRMHIDLGESIMYPYIHPGKKVSEIDRLVAQDIIYGDPTK